MIYKSSWNHKGNRETFKDLFGCLRIVFEVCDVVFHFHHLTSPLTYFGGLHLTHFFIISSSFPMIQLSVGCANSRGENSSFGHEIQRSTLQKIHRLLRHLSVG